jgi:hypothetical protein
VIDDTRRVELRQLAWEAEQALHEYRDSLAPRPDRKSGHKPTPEELVRWPRESARFQELLAAYRAAAHRSLLPEPLPCGEPWDGGCNCTWGEAHVCQRSHGHAPPYSDEMTRPPSGTHTCRCGAVAGKDARDVRAASQPVAVQAA